MPYIKNIKQISKLTTWIHNLTNNYVNSFSCSNGKELSPKLKANISENISPYKTIFKNSLIQLRANKKLPEIICSIQQEWSDFLTNSTHSQNSASIDFRNCSIFTVDDLHSDLCGENLFLKRAVDTFKENSHLFTVSIINGSLGTNDYKPGWSDVDIFCVLNKKTCIDPQLLEQSKAILARINKEIYKYNVLQLHKAFVSFEPLFQNYQTGFLPVVCVNNGKYILKNTETLLTQQTDQTINRLSYFKNHIYRDSKKLLKKNLSLHEKTLLFHRIYSFPFSFLQIFGENIYKKESFDMLATEFSDVFPEIKVFYQNINSFYHNWEIKSLETISLRDTLLEKHHPKKINQELALKETEIKNRIEHRYQKFIKKEKDAYLKHLRLAKDYLIEKNIWRNNS